MWTQIQDSRNRTQLRNSFNTVKPQKSKTVRTGKVTGTQLSGTSQQRETIYPKDNEGRRNRWGTQLKTQEATLTKIKQEETQRNTKRQKDKKTKTAKVTTEKTETREVGRKPQTRLKPGAEAEIQTTQTRACCKKTVTGTTEHAELHFVDAPCTQSRGVSGYERTKYKFSPQNFKFVNLFPISS